MRPLVNQHIGSYRNLGKRRRRAAPIWRKIFSTRTFGPFIAGLILFGVIYLCYVFPLNGWLPIIEKKFMDTSVSLGFSLQNVFVEGRKNTRVEEILQNMQVEKGMPILNLDTDAILKNIKNLPWVKEGLIKRKLPSSIFVYLEEKRPIALWKSADKFLLIAEWGAVINTKEIDGYNGLILISGIDAPRFVTNLIQIINLVPNLAKNVKAATRVGARRWDVFLKDGTKIMLPESGTLTAWVRLGEIFNKNIIFRETNLVDLRIRDRIILRKPNDIEINENKRGFSKQLLRGSSHKDI